MTVAKYETGLSKITNAIAPMISSQLSNNGIEMTDYQRQVVISAISAINTTLENSSLSISQIDQSNLTQILLTVAALQLNADATPREVYFIVRKSKNAKPKIEMNIEGDGNDALLARFGRDVKKIYPYWAIREGDDFTYPSHRGVETTPPTWVEKGIGKVIRVVYPIESQNGSINYYIGERADVKKNLIAHMMNNLMWDKDKIAKKTEIRQKTENMTLDEILDDDDLVKTGQISPAWREPQSRESMIIRKMRNNVTKKIPKDFSSSFVANQYQEVTDPEAAKVRKDVTEHANSEDFEQAKIEASKPEKNEPKEGWKPAPEGVSQASEVVKPQQPEIIDAPTKEEAPQEPEPSIFDDDEDPF